MATASTLMQKSAEILNDANRNMWTDEVLLPMLVLAFQELELDFADHSLPAVQEISTPVVIAAGVKTLTPMDDFVAPISLEERVIGGTEEDWIPMIQKLWEPDTLRPSNTLVYWAYRESKFNFVGATTDREVRYRYYKDFTDPTNGTYPVNIPNSTLFLEHKTASNAARFIGQRPKLADELGGMSAKYLAQCVNREVKSTQNIPRRRKGFGWTRKMLARM